MDTGEHIGQYVVERRIGAGGMAEVLLCRVEGPAGFEKLVVLKRILESKLEDERYLKLFLDEARIAALFRHPNLVQVQALEQIGGRYFMVMEYIEGLDLDRVLDACERNNTFIPFEIAATFIAEAAEGLHYAHELTTPDGTPLHLVHRDISPANIIATWLGTTKVVDFGIAKHRTQTHQTQTGELKGKLSYMSPEQARGMPLDQRSDVFSLGAVLYELLTGVSCFKRETPIATLSAVVDTIFVPVSEYREGIPDALERVLQRTLAPAVESRYETALKLSEALHTYLRSVGAPRAADIVAFLRELQTAQTADSDRCFTASGLLSESELETMSHGPDALWAPSLSLPVERPTTPVREATRLADEPVHAHLGHDAGEEATVQVTDPRNAFAERPTAELDESSPEQLALSQATRAERGKGPPRQAAAAIEVQESAAGGTEATVRAAEPIMSAGESAPRRKTSPIAALVLLGLVAIGLILALVWITGRGPERAKPEPILASAIADAGPSPSLAAKASDGGVPDRAERDGDVPDRAERDGGVPDRAERDIRGSAQPAAHRDATSGVDSQVGRIGEAERQRPQVPRRPAQLSISSEPKTRVHIDGRLAGVTPIQRHRLLAGGHNVVLSNKKLGLRKTLRVKLEPGQHVERRVVFGEGKLMLEVLPWAEVHLRGKKLGVTPLPPIRLYEGTHALVLKNPERGVQRVIKVRIEAGKTTKLLERL